MSRFCFLIFLFFILSLERNLASASSRKPIILIQVKNQINLTEKILIEKLNDLENLKVQLSEIDSHLGVIKGFSMSERAMALYKQKSKLVDILSQTELDIKSLNENLQLLIVKKSSLSRQVSSVN